MLQVTKAYLNPLSDNPLNMAEVLPNLLMSSGIQVKGKLMASTEEEEEDYRINLLPSFVQTNEPSSVGKSKRRSTKKLAP